MAKKKSIEKKLEKCCGNWSGSCKGGGGCVYFLGFVGAAIYYISQATGFWNGVLGVLKALVWPGFLVYELLKFLGV
ncbi:hypothetical protein CMO83_03435 [Candidatus Woesearchaeota archaeon]|jgi:hypothetical protein|nr:hypothetical protein [Candidatus Woesearchaeota archaeon]|tara:strand:+ start:11533 stop:11760 length:228 start_codon:yes stop_codon:yes gene_type:complete